MAPSPAFIIKPLPKVRSLPNFIYATKPISSDTVKKEIAFGAAMAVASVYMGGHHHHLITFNELEQTMATEAVNFASSIDYKKKTLIEKIKSQNKNKLLIYVLTGMLFSQLTTMFLRLIIFQSLSILF